MVLWAKNAGGFNGAAISKDMAIDETGNIYIAGSYGSENIKFGT